MPTIKPTTNTPSGSDDFAKTILPGSGRTILPGAGKTILPDTGKTILPNVGKTILPDTGKTILPGDAAKAVLPGQTGGVGDVQPTIAVGTGGAAGMIDTNMYQPRSSYTINGSDYQVIRPLSLTSGEAQVFLVKSPTGDTLVLKLYYKGSVPSMAVLDKVESVNQAGLFLKEISHGTFEDRFFELMEYYDGDSMDSINVKTDEATVTTLIKDMAIAIDACHQLGFIHRDIKPANFVFSDKRQTSLLLGDFGIAVECDKNGEAVSDMARTKTFAAPEVYLNTGDGRARFSTKSDFYSLGMVIIYLWMGKERFNDFEKENELQLATMKAYGTLPVPANMPLRLFSLVKALIEPNPAKRAGFKEVGEWLNGGNPFAPAASQLATADAKAPKFKIVFSGDKNLIAFSPKELANMMYANSSLAITYLYKGKIAGWLEANGRPELAIEMDRIKDDLYPRDQSAGLEAACYILNPSMPFEDICGNNCKTSAEIAASILASFDKYLAQLSNNINCRLTVFLQTHGLESVVIEFRRAFSENKRLGLLYLAYRLDANQPWHMTDDKGRQGSFKTEDEILDWVSQYAASDQSLCDIVSKAFLLWVGKRNSIAAAAISPLIQPQGNIENSEGVLYRLNPKVGLYFVRDENSPNYILSVEKMGELFNRCILAVVNKSDPSGNSSSIIAELLDIQKGKTPSVYHFLKSKGAAYEKWIDWIKYCLDTHSTDNVKKAGPYNSLIGLFKLAKGMAGSSFYTFKSGKTITKPADISTVSASDLQDAKSNPLRPLEAWISIFFQEDPKLDKTPQYAYEERMPLYMRFLKTQGFKCDELQRYDDAKEVVESRAERLRSSLSLIKKSRIAVFLLSVLPLGVSALLLAFLWRPEFGQLTFDDLFWPTAIILTIVFCIWSGFAGKVIGELIWGCIVSALCSGIIAWAISNALALTPYIAAVMVALLAVAFGHKCIMSDLKEKSNKDLIEPGFEHLELEPLHHAFHPQPGGFDSSIGDRTKTYQNNLNQLKKTMWLRAIPVGVVTILAAVYFMYATPSSFLGGSKEDEKIETAAIAAPDFTNGLYGTWVGGVKGTSAMFVFSPADNNNPNYFEMVQQVTQRGEAGMVLAGTFHAESGKLTIEQLGMVTNGTTKKLKVSGTMYLNGNKIVGEITIKDRRQTITVPIDLEYVPE